MKITFVVALIIFAFHVSVEGAELNLETFLSKQCNSDGVHLNFTTVKTIELDGDGKPEYIALYSGNNFTDHYYFSLEECGYSIIKTNMGEPLSSLGGSGSFSCAPHGCFAVVRCKLGQNLNHLSILELPNTEHAAVLISGEPEGYDFSSELTETMYSYTNGVANVLWTETKTYPESLISKLKSSQRFHACE